MGLTIKQYVNYLIEAYTMDFQYFIAAVCQSPSILLPFSALFNGQELIEEEEIREILQGPTKSDRSETASEPFNRLDLFCLYPFHNRLQKLSNMPNYSLERQKLYERAERFQIHMCNSQIRV